MALTPINNDILDFAFLSQVYSMFYFKIFFFAFQLLHSLFSFIRYEIQAVRNSLLSGETENSTMPWKTTEKIFRWMDEIRRQIGVVYKEDT